MFRNIHLKMTFFCTLIIGFILAAMTLSGLFLFEGLLKKNDSASFEKDRNSIFAYLEGETLIDYGQLSKLADNQVYAIALFEKDRRISWSPKSTTSPQEYAIQKACKEAQELYGFDVLNPPRSKTITGSTNFSMNCKKREYLVSCASLSNKYGELCVLILYSRTELKQQIFHLRMRFFLIDLTALLLVLLFAWKFSGSILAPIEENRKKQVQFVAAASHELRSPLAVMLSAVSALKVADPGDQAVFFQSVESEGKRMTRLIDDMLSLSNADSQSWTLEFEDVQLDTLLLEIYEKYSPLVRNHRQTLEISLEDTLLPHCRCDRQRMEQVLNILLDNAVSYTPEYGTIELGISSGKGQILLWIADSGPGISEESKALIFDRFYRSDISRKDKQHFGLGLCIAKEIIQLHHGKIWVENNVPTGAVFYLALPVHRK